MNHLYACIMAGGTGSRFWPASTVKKPKQLLAIGTDKPLLNMTIDRISSLVDPERRIIVTGDPIQTEVREALPDIPAANIISEPSRRNTAPCILLAAKVIAARDPEGIMCVLPSDHLVKRPNEFLSVIESAAQLASEEDVLVTLGILPTYPETGYGYIEFGEVAGSSLNRDYHRITDFHEKPRAERAKAFLASGNFYWNSGMFVWKAQSILNAIQRHLPNIYKAFEDIDPLALPEEFKKQIDELYPKIQGISIDYGVMERADNIYGFVADIGWNDVGSWTSLTDLIESDDFGNVAQGNYLSIDSKGCIASVKEGVIVTLGVDDLIVVHTPKATLVCHKSRAQEIKKVFDLLEGQGLEEYL